MFRSSLLYISPPDGIVEGETEERLTPLTGYFAIRTCKGGLERAMSVRDIGGKWEVTLDGFLVAKPHEQWIHAAGFMGIWAFVLGRRLTPKEYNALVTIRAADKERGIDLSAPVNLNDVEIPTFGAST